MPKSEQFGLDFIGVFVYDVETQRKIKMSEEKPKFCTDEHLEYLDDLRSSGETNMYGAKPYLLREFPTLTKEQARDILLYWMDSFAERHNIKE